MQIEQLPSRREKKSSTSFKLLLSLLVTVFLTGTILISFYVFETKPNEEQVNPYPEPYAYEEGGTFYPLVFQGVLQEDMIMMEGDEFLVNLNTLQAYVDPTLHYDSNEKVLVFTTENKVMTLKNRHITNELKGESTELQFPIIEIEGEVYVPYAPFAQIYPFTLQFYEQMNVVELQADDQAVVEGKVFTPAKKEGDEPPAVFVRTEPTITAPFVQSVTHDAVVQIFFERDAWYYVQTTSGALGYIPKEDVLLQGIVEPAISQSAAEQKNEQSFQAWNPVGSKINLTWEHVVRRTPNPEGIEPMPGVHVVSPTWFHFQDEEGNLSNLAEKRYVDWAHQQGYKVWALITNDFDPDLTHTILSSYEKRRNVILQLVHFADIYELDGINIDFENVYLKDKENLVQFMREFTPYMHDLGLVVSIDVTIKSNSEMWSMFLDRRALGQIVDYMMVMTYDEHWGSSPVSGSVASLPWVERGLQGVLEEVPNDKVLLGVPFYTRLWKEEKDENGEIKVSSRAYSMSGIEEWMRERNVTAIFDENTGQHYAEYEDTSEAAVYKIWLEDERSMSQRVELVQKYDLAGIASWRRGFEKPVIWEVIDEGLQTYR